MNQNYFYTIQYFLISGDLINYIKADLVRHSVKMILSWNQNKYSNI